MLGRLNSSVPRSKRLLSDDRSNILVYMTGVCVCAHACVCVCVCVCVHVCVRACACVCVHGSVFLASNSLSSCFIAKLCSRVECWYHRDAHYASDTCCDIEQTIIVKCASLVCVSATVHCNSLENLWDVENYRHSSNVQRSIQVMVETAFWSSRTQKKYRALSLEMPLSKCGRKWGKLKFE